MKLGRLIQGLAKNDFSGDPETKIEGLAYDSRKIRPGYMFIALRGHAMDGHDFLGEAIREGASALVVESSHAGLKGVKEAAVVRVKDTRRALSRLAVNFYEEPFSGVNLIGVTGTNGKTTTSYLLESIVLAGGGTPGVTGTINYRMPGETFRATVTTPESLDLMEMLRTMADSGVTDVIMEVSSHALDQGRTVDCPFRVAVFTNLSRDHLDYHGSMEAYFKAKSRLFYGLGGREGNDTSRAVINWDDPMGRSMAELTRVPVMTYGLGGECHVRADRVRGSLEGLKARLTTPMGDMDIRSSLIGGFNIYNIMAAASAALCMGSGLETIAEGIAGLRGVPGRLERVENARSLSILVDYAHTPDALKKAIEAVRPLAAGRLITVFGCGGDRDKGKREEMGRVAGELSDIVFITSDNPRTEDPATIASRIEPGVRETGLCRIDETSASGLMGTGYILDLDRRSAIQRAVQAANEDDLILIAGKGHEDYQIIGGEKRDFDDREVATEAASI
jgi:UDP-N-acetylmuramoyl-L-alanyl-D-glutamate--2,6-diaminopimelate ligase